MATKVLPNDWEVPRLKTGRAGDNRRRLDADDILELFSCLDVKKAVLPVFVDVKMSRLPSVKTSDVDVCSLAASVAELRGRVTEIMATLKSLVDARLYSQVQNLTDSICHIRAQMAEVISSTTQQVVITREKGNNHNPVDVGFLPVPSHA